MSARPNQRKRRLAWIRYALETRGASSHGLILVVLMGFLGAAQILPNFSLNVGLLLIVAFEFQKRMDQGVPLLQLTSLIAVLQWLVGPTINYATAYSYGRYSMYVPEAEYFRFAIPATAFYVAAMLATGASVRQSNLLEAVDNRRFFTIGVLLNLTAIVASIAALRLSGSLAFFLHLISQLRYIGALYFLFSRNQLRLLFAAASCIQLFTRSLGAGMFHDLILWLALIFCYWFGRRKWAVPVKLMVLSAVCFGLFSVQVVKQEYRNQLRKGMQPNILVLISEYVTPGGQAWETDTVNLAVTRLNQGWIISAIMKNVPESEPFACGETVKEALFSSLVPRFLAPDKKRAGGRENFRRFTGLQIADSTSMAISPLGEAYANFGPMGGIIFMVCFAAVFSAAYYGTLRYALKYPTFLFWIPLIFYQAIKAETELVVVVNQLTKGAVVAFGCHFLIRQVFGTQIKSLHTAQEKTQIAS